jgi:hypothetical protein
LPRKPANMGCSSQSMDNHRMHNEWLGRTDRRIPVFSPPILI